MTCVKIQLSDHIQSGVNVLVPVAHLRQVLRAGEHDFLAIQDNVIRALIDAVQNIEVVLVFGLPVKQVADIFPMEQVAALAEDEVSVPFSLRFFGIAEDVRGRGDRPAFRISFNCRIRAADLPEVFPGGRIEANGRGGQGYGAFRGAVCLRAGVRALCAGTCICGLRTSVSHGLRTSVCRSGSLR